MKLVTLPPQPQDSPRGHARIPHRYEDIAQDGRLLLELASRGVGEVVWQQLLANLPNRDMFRETGIVPILTRMIVVGGEGPFSVNAAIEGHGTYAIARTGASRIYVDMWTTLLARHGSTWETTPDRGGEPVVALATFAEHVLTKLFAPPHERRVTSLPDGDVPERAFALPELQHPLTPPANAELLDATLRPDTQPFVFGLRHTDSNQHVNSLVYPRLFEEALLRRLHEHGRATTVLATEVDCAYRKPCFAGDVVRYWLQAFVLNGQPGAVGVLLPEGQSPESGKPHTFVRILMR